MDDGQEFSAGTRIADRYRIDALVGRGGMGSVWRASDETLNRIVALKRVRLDDHSPAERAIARERVLREARIAAKLHHPNVVTIFDIVERDEPWLVLEYVPARSLADLLAERGPLPPGEVAAIGAQIATALAVAHAVGVVHRDVKPDNVLVTEPYPIAKLTDFGISHATNTPTLTSTGVVTGTPAYFSPETARGEGTDPRSDVYSLGATLCTAVEGHPPFGAEPENLLALLTRIGRGGAPPPRQAGPLTEVLRWLLLDDPAARPTAAQAHHALQEVAVRATTRQPPPMRPPAETHAGPTPGPRRRQRRRIAAVAALAAVALATTAGMIATREPAAPDAPPTPAPSEPPLAPAGIVIGDPQTADPCSLLDEAAIRRHGTPHVNHEDAAFGTCGAYLRDTVSVFVSFDSWAVTDTPPGSTPQTVGPLRVTRHDVGWRCGSLIHLSDGNLVSVKVDSFADPPDGDLCAIGETTTAAAVQILLEKGVGRRQRADVTQLLARVDACSLLTPNDLAVVPELATAAQQPGFGNWSCDWESGETSVDVFFQRSVPLDEGAGQATVFAGRSGFLGPEVNGACTAHIHYGDAGNRVDVVKIVVLGPQPEAERCAYARALGSAAAGRLPS